MRAELIDAINDHWPLILFGIGAAWGFLVWMKKQLLDNVYATKRELDLAKDELEARMADNERQDVVRYADLRKTIALNHDEVKSLIIRVLDK